MTFDEILLKHFLADKIKKNVDDFNSNLTEGSQNLCSKYVLSIFIEFVARSLAFLVLFCVLCFFPILGLVVKLFSYVYL